MLPCKEGTDDAATDALNPPSQTPTFYESAPPSPVGLKWWRYSPGVPGLPPAPPGYGWQYDSSYTSTSYSFTNLDKVWFGWWIIHSCEPQDLCHIRGVCLSMACTHNVFGDCRCTDAL